MTLVTLTDHDTISGGLELIERPDFFLSEEITALFPENGCVMHVLAWNITPSQHEHIQERRRDIYRLAEYLSREGIAHGLAHPLLSPSWQLDAETRSRSCCCCSRRSEGLNGPHRRAYRAGPDRDAPSRITPDVIARLSRKTTASPRTVRRPTAKL